MRVRRALLYVAIDASVDLIGKELVQLRSDRYVRER